MAKTSNYTMKINFNCEKLLFSEQKVYDNDGQSDDGLTVVDSIDNIDYKKFLT